MAVSHAVILVEMIEGLPFITAVAIGPQRTPWVQPGAFGGRNFQVVVASSDDEPTQEDADREVRRIIGYRTDAQLDNVLNDGKNRSTRLMNFCLRVIGIALRLRFAAAGLGGYLGGVDDIAKTVRGSLQGVSGDQRNSEAERAEAEAEVKYMTEDLEARVSLDKDRGAVRAALFGLSQSDG